MNQIYLKTLLAGALQVLIPGLAFAFCFEEAGSRYTLSPELLESIATIESGMNPAARNQNRNGSTDFGLMQINSYWIKAANLDRDRLLNDACYNTQAGARVLRGCIDRYGYTWEAVGCYNATSTDKRKNYAWKVYRQIGAEGKEKRRIVPSPKPKGSKVLVADRNIGSLTFIIEDPRKAGQWDPDHGVGND